MLTFQMLIYALYNAWCLILYVTGQNIFSRPLSAADERECFKAMKDGDPCAREKLIEHNLRLVAHIVKKYNARPQESEDLISIGTIGLIKAVNTFDADKGSRFATYASRCIDNEILMHLRSSKRLSCEVSLYEPIESDSDGNALAIMDVLKTEDTVSDEVALKIQTERLLECINSVLNTRERKIIKSRYGLYGMRPLTQMEAADRLGISRSYVSRIEKKALEKLRDALKSK
ncbi:MAG: RNA polymerase sporulation sigma factor SigK [Clostridia bacterium]|nr:RNA polymerase sporulation sigma factor SigK [Clostridia bacterium]